MKPGPRIYFVDITQNKNKMIYAIFALEQQYVYVKLTFYALKKNWETI
jgi:hypothetical protein